MRLTHTRTFAHSVHVNAREMVDKPARETPLRVLRDPLTCMVDLESETGPCGRALPGSDEERAALDASSSCRAGQGGRSDCEHCRESEARHG